MNIGLSMFVNQAVRNGWPVPTVPAVPWLWVCLAWFVLGGLFGLRAAPSARAKPRATVPADTWNFGYLPQKSEVSHTFYLHNTGSAPLSVTKIKTGCSCTSVSKIDRPIATGDSIAITVTFKSGRYYRTVTKTTKVHTDDPDTAVQKLHIAAHIIKQGEPAGSLQVSPQRLEWESVNGHLAADQDTVIIANTGGDSLRVVVLHYPQNILDGVDVPNALPPSEEVNIVLRASAGPAGDDLHGLSATLAFIGRDTTILTIPIVVKQ